MSINITSTKEHKDKVNIIVYGRGGMGKTRLCATAPTPLILSAESGLLSLKDYDLDVIKINSIKDVYDAYEFITESNDAKKYETICLDSVSEIAEVLLIEHKKLSDDPRKSYPKLSDDMSSLLRGYRDLPDKHVYFSCKQVKVVDENNGITTYQPMMPGSNLMNNIGYFFDEVANIRIFKDDEGEEYRALQCIPDRTYDAKDRSSELDKIEKPDLTYIFNKCMGKE